MATKTKAKRLTAKSIEAIEADPVARREVPDGGVAGLYLVVRQSGAKSWALRYRHEGKPRKMTLGQYPKMSLASARNRANEALDKLMLGEDPAADALAEKAAAKAASEADRDLVKGVVANFIRRHCSKRKDAPGRRDCSRRTSFPR